MRLSRKSILLWMFNELRDFILQLSGVQHVMISTDLQKTDFAALNIKLIILFINHVQAYFYTIKPLWNEQLTDVV